MKEISRSTSGELQDRLKKTTAAITTINTLVQTNVLTDPISSAVEFQADALSTDSIAVERKTIDPDQNETALHVAVSLQSRVLNIVSELDQRKNAPAKPYNHAEWVYKASNGKRTEGYAARLLNQIKDGDIQGYTKIGVLAERLYAEDTPETRLYTHNIIRRANEFLEIEGKTIKRIHSQKKPNKKQATVGYFLTTIDSENSIHTQPKDPFMNDDLEVLDDDDGPKTAISSDTQSNIFNENLNNMNIVEIDEKVRTFIGNLQITNPTITTLEAYQKLAEQFPIAIPKERLYEALQAREGINSEEIQRGLHVFIYLNLRTIFHTLHPFMTDDREMNNEIFQEVLTSLYERVGEIDENEKNIDQKIMDYVKSGASRAISNMTSIPEEWITSEKFQDVKGIIDEKAIERVYSNDETLFRNLGTELAQIGIPQDTIKDYIEFLKNLHHGNLEDIPVLFSPEESIEKANLRKDFVVVLNQLTPEYKRALALKYDFEPYYDYGREKTDKEVGQIMGISGRRVNKIIAIALRRLRWPTNSRKLRHYHGDNW